MLNIIRLSNKMKAKANFTVEITDWLRKFDHFKIILHPQL
jgi:hypothetical protein